MAYTALLLVFSTLAERELGTWRTAAIFLTSHVIGVFLGLELVLIGQNLHWSWLESLVGEVAAGPPIGGVGLALALTFRISAFLLTHEPPSDYGSAHHLSKIPPNGERTSTLRHERASGLRSGRDDQRLASSSGSLLRPKFWGRVGPGRSLLATVFTVQ